MLEGVIRGCSGLQGKNGATRGYKGLPEVIEVTKDYPGSQGVTLGHTWLQGVTMELQAVGRGYKGLEIVTGS